MGLFMLVSEVIECNSHLASNDIDSILAQKDIFPHLKLEQKAIATLLSSDATDVIMMDNVDMTFIQHAVEAAAASTEVKLGREEVRRMFEVTGKFKVRPEEESE